MSVLVTMQLNSSWAHTQKRDCGTLGRVHVQLQETHTPSIDSQGPGSAPHQLCLSHYAPLVGALHETHRELWSEALMTSSYPGKALMVYREMF